MLILRKSPHDADASSIYLHSIVICCANGLLISRSPQQDFETNGNGCYDCMLLYNQVQKLPFRDHNAPPLLVLVGFCRQATAWMNENPANIVSVSTDSLPLRSTFNCARLSPRQCALILILIYRLFQTGPLSRWKGSIWYLLFITNALDWLWVECCRSFRSICPTSNGSSNR